jgi:pimeloyl-ACP methyl ester carboxylesterase
MSSPTRGAQEQTPAVFEPPEVAPYGCRVTGERSTIVPPAPPAAPDWFRRALAVPYTDEFVKVDGAAIHYLAWGEPGRRGMVFVHGGGAHAHWWTHVAARFADDFRVLAIDLSGHGDSDHRSAYSLDQWTDEVVAVARAGDIGGPPVIVGHSMGGFVTIATAGRHPDDLAGAVVCDSPVSAPDPEINAANVGSAFGAPRTYPTVDAALERFRTVPPQDHYLDYVIDHVARQSVRPADGGWQWKFDRAVFAQFGSRGSIRSSALPYVPQVRCRLALLRSENGLVTKDIGAEMYEALGRVAPIVEIPEAGHHAMLDQPLILLTALRTLVADWDHSDPHRRHDR